MREEHGRHAGQFGDGLRYRGAAAGGSVRRSAGNRRLKALSTGAGRLAVPVRPAIGAASRKRLTLQLASVTLTPFAARLNFKPTSVECSLITTPCSFLRYATEPPPATVNPA